MSDGMNINTGYGNQTKGICKGLSDEYEVFNLNFQYHGQPINLDGVTILPNGYHPWGEDILPKHLENIKPDLVITLLDMFRAPYLKNFNFHKYGTKWLAYYPLDASPTPLGSEGVFEHADHLVAMAKYGQQLLKEEKGIESDRIWHGTDTEVYKPEDIKKEGLMENKFIVGSVFRNCARKNPSALLTAFYKFAKDKDDVMLYCHTDPSDKQGFNIGAYGQRLGLLKPDPTKCKIIFTNFHSVFFSLSDSALARIYNTFDFHTLSTTGEGFGIPIIESMACGKPNVLTDYTTTEELIGEDKGLKVKCGFYPTQCVHLTERAWININDMRDKFQMMYDLNHNGGIKQVYQQKCRDYAVENFDWKKVIVPQWKRLIGKII